MNQRTKREKAYETSRLRVYKSKDGKFAIDGVISKERIRKQYSILEEAKAECHRLEEGASDERVLRTTLSRMQLNEAEEAFKQLPCELTLLNAVHAFLSNYQPKENRITEIIPIRNRRVRRWMLLRGWSSRSGRVCLPGQLILLGLIQLGNARLRIRCLPRVWRRW